MADQKYDNLSGGIGDIGDILHNQGVSDLSWLAVDEATYRASEALPKQNLDTIPELQKALVREEGDDVPHLIPLKPHVIVNRNPLDYQHHSVDMSVPIKNRVARYVLSGKEPADIRDRVLLEFSESDVRNASSHISEVMSERGVLGTVYVDSSYFPNCDQLSGDDKKLITACSKRSLLLVSKPDCSGCVHNRDGRCASMKMPLVASVNYGPELALNLSSRLASENRILRNPIQDDPESWKLAIKTAFLQSPSFKNPDGVRTVHTQQPKPQKLVTSSEVKSFLSRVEVKEETLSPSYIKFARRMMEGHDDRQLLLSSGDPDLVRLASEYGLLGHSWIDLDALGSCKKGLGFLNRSDSDIAPDFFIRRSSSCPYCRDASDGACCRISSVSKIVPFAPPYDKRSLASALLRAVRRGSIDNSSASKAIRTASDGSDWKSLTAQANLYSPVPVSTSEYAGIRNVAWFGPEVRPHHEMDEQEVRKTISSLMNQGMSGPALQEMILNRYSTEDLAPFPGLGKRLASEDGIQGFYYIDPTAYNDYGSGCSEGSSKFRKRGAPHIMASDRCTGCTLQTHPGWCSKYAKTMIRSVPSTVRSAAKRSLPVVQSAFVENPVDKYELASSLAFDGFAEKRSIVDISLHERSIDK